MNVQQFNIPGLLLFEPKRFGDSRGWFAEVWEANRYRDAGIKETFVQDNLAKSTNGVLRGLHAQEPHAQGKLVQVYSGVVFDVAVDMRKNSPTFGKWEAVTLDGDRGKQFYIPPGCLHGYYVLSNEALFGYKTTDFYSPQSEWSIRWDDPVIGIEWPLQGEPILSDKDKNAPSFTDTPPSRMSKY